MFSKDITSSDLFVDMPASSQLLYFQLGMEADDEGFIGNAKMLSRAYGANNDDLKLLQAKGFIIIFESGVTVIRDWNINNQIRKDRFRPTIYQNEKSLLSVSPTGSYQLVNQMTTTWQPNDNQMTTTWQPNDNQMTTTWQPNDNQLGNHLATQYRIGKDSKGKVSLGKESVVEKASNQPATNLGDISDYFQQEIGLLSPNQFEQLSDYLEIDNFEVDVIKRAIDKAANSAKRSFGYVNGILRGWKQNGIKTIAQVDEEQRKFVESKHVSKNSTEDLHNVVDPEFGF